MRFSLFARFKRAIKVAVGLHKREQNSLKVLQNANKSFAISVVIPEPVIPVAMAASTSDTSSEESVRQFCWGRTWSNNRDFRKPTHYRGVKIKGKMFAVPCGDGFKKAS